MTKEARKVGENTDTGVKPRWLSVGLQSREAAALAEVVYDDVLEIELRRRKLASQTSPEIVDAVTEVVRWELMELPKRTNQFQTAYRRANG